MDESLVQTRINKLDMTKEVPVFYFYKTKPKLDLWTLYAHLERGAWSL